MLGKIEIKLFKLISTTLERKDLQSSSGPKKQGCGSVICTLLVDLKVTERFISLLPGGLWNCHELF